jgi:GT2 family glycosyltransferase
MEPLVSVTIVTHNSAGYLDACLESVRRQDYSRLEIVVVDNSSADGTAEILGLHGERLRVIRNSFNNGFCGGQNQAITASRGQWILVLNPDVILALDFVSRLVASIDAQADPAIGVACGRLTAPSKENDHALLDSTGIYLTPELRHFDRDCRQPDSGQHLETEYVFGATGAAAFYRREMIDAISVPGKPGPEFFDEEFFAYREDADVAWRAQLLGWNCLYVPEAHGTHVRTCLPDNRAKMSPLVNMHSVKNRFLMRIKNIGAGLYLRHCLAITARDICVAGYCLLMERRSLPGLWHVVSGFPRTWAKRNWIQSRRKRSDRELAAWFQGQRENSPAIALATEKISPPTAANATLGGRP